MKLIPNLAEIDRRTVLEAGVSADVLMETAGTRVSDQVIAMARPGQMGVLLCGPGNNGGDGFVCARKLYQAGFKKLSVLYTGKGYQREALHNFEQLMLLPVEVIDGPTQTELALQRLGQAAFIVDALFGSGLARPVEGLEARLVEAANAQKSRQPQTGVISVDIPSGIDGATGQVMGCAIRADATVTFATGKPGLYLYPGKAYAGRVEVVDIGIPEKFIAEDESPVRLIGTALARSWLPPRPPESHKYTFGHVLVVAGSHHMPGAAVLCADAAMSAGAGLVTLAAPSDVFHQVPLMPEIIRLPLPDAEHLGQASVVTLQEALATGKYNTLIIGPGLDRAAETFQAVITLLSHLNLPVVVDADGLNALSAMKNVYQQALESGDRPPLILTPHIGECSRLLQQDKAALQGDLLKTARSAQEAWQATVVLKAASSVIASPEGLLYVSPTGNSGMATAGSGDVLTGIIGALAAQRHAQQLPVEPAAALGVYLHGLAGDDAARVLTPYAMRASDITRHLPNAFKALARSADTLTEDYSGQHL